MNFGQIADVLVLCKRLKKNAFTIRKQSLRNIYLMKFKKIVSNNNESLEKNVCSIAGTDATLCILVNPEGEGSVLEMENFNVLNNFRLFYIFIPNKTILVPHNEISSLINI